MTSMIAGISRIETRMVLRRRSLWMALVPAYLVILLLGVTSSGLNAGHGLARVSDWGVFMNLLLGLVFGAAFVGTLGMRGNDGMTQVQRSTPTPAWKQLVARVLATLTVTSPALVILFLVGVYVGITQNSWGAIPAAFTVYVLITLPATLFVLGVVAVAERLLPAAFARIVAVMVWGWAALFDTPTIPGPSLGGTVFSPTGMSVSKAIFGSKVWSHTYTPLFAWANLAVVLLIGVAAIVISGLARRRSAA